MSEKVVGSLVGSLEEQYQEDERCKVLGEMGDAGGSLGRSFEGQDWEGERRKALG